MPHGTRHVLTGVLRFTSLGYVLHVDGGGVWRLDTPRRLRALCDTRVTIEGTRCAFDGIDVERITPA